MTEPVITARSFYDHTHPDTEYFAPSAHCTMSGPAVDEICTDQTNTLTQEEQGP